MFANLQIRSWVESVRAKHDFCHTIYTHLLPVMCSVTLLLNVVALSWFAAASFMASTLVCG
jgi:hypothetical protein